MISNLRCILGRLRPNWELVSAHTARNALVELANRQFEVLVTDLDRPGTNGLALLELAQRRHPYTACVVHPAQLEAQRDHPSLRHVSEFVAKPADPEELVGALNLALWRSLSARPRKSAAAVGRRLAL